MVKLTQIQKKKKEFEKKRNQAIKDLEKIEKKHGHKIFRSACNRKLTIDREKKKRLEKIKKMEKELSKLRKGQLPTY